MSISKSVSNRCWDMAKVLHLFSIQTTHFWHRHSRWKRYLCLLHAIFYLTIIIHNNHQAILLRHHHHQHYHGGFHHIRMEEMTTFARNISSEFPNKSHWKIWRMNFDLCGKFTFYTEQNTNMERRHCVAGIGIDAYVCHPSIYSSSFDERALLYTKIQLIVDDELCVNLTKLTTLRNQQRMCCRLLTPLFLLCLSLQPFLKCKPIQNLWKATHSSFRLSRH